jgi:hypothetical protein
MCVAVPDLAPPSDFVVPPDFADPIVLGCGTDLAMPPCQGDGGCTCDPANPAAFQLRMEQSPIVLPNHVAGVNLVPRAEGTITWGELAADLCAPASIFDVPDGGVPPAIAGIDISGKPTDRIRQLNLWPGFLGVLEFRSADCRHGYRMVLDDVVQRDGAPFLLDWTDSAKVGAEVDELYRGMMATFLPSTPPEAAGTTCVAAKTCVIGNFGDVSYVYVAALGFAFWVDDIHAKQPIASSPARFDLAVVP